MGLVGSEFTGGTAMLGFLLAAEVIAAAAVVSEAALIYVARKRNMLISLVDAGARGGPCGRLDPDHAGRGSAADLPGDRARRSLCASRWPSPRSPSRGCCKRSFGAPVSGWRWDIAWAAAAASWSACRCASSCRRLLQLIIGVPAILAAFGAVLWTKGFGPEDRELFRCARDDVEELREAEARTARDHGRAQARRAL